MKTFKLDHDGDVVINNNKIEYVEGVELVAQTVRQVLNTNLGEWFNDADEGIDFHVVLTKNPNFDLIQDTINTAVQQVADGLQIKLETDGFTFETKGRQLSIAFTLTMENTDSTSIELTL